MCHYYWHCQPALTVSILFLRKWWGLSYIYKCTVLLEFFVATLFRWFAHSGLWRKKLMIFIFRWFVNKSFYFEWNKIFHCYLYFTDRIIAVNITNFNNKWQFLLISYSTVLYVEVFRACGWKKYYSPWTFSGYGWGEGVEISFAEKCSCDVWYWIFIFPAIWMIFVQTNYFYICFTIFT